MRLCQGAMSRLDASESSEDANAYRKTAKCDHLQALWVERFSFNRGWVINDVARALASDVGMIAASTRVAHFSDSARSASKAIRSSGVIRLKPGMIPTGADRANVHPSRDGEACAPVHFIPAFRLSSMTLHALKRSGPFLGRTVELLNAAWIKVEERLLP
jgi:hypothetical protein